MFDVFDEWGNYVGRFTPSGGILQGLLGVLVLIIAWSVGILVYSFFRLVVRGFQSAIAGEWVSALGYWSGPMIVSIIIGTLLLGGNVSALVAHNQQLKQDAQTTQAITQLEQNPPISVSASRGPCPNDAVCSWGNVGPYVVINVENSWSGSVTVHPTDLSGPTCFLLPDSEALPIEMSAGSKSTFYCADFYTDLSKVDNICLTFEYNISSNDPMHIYHPSVNICRNLPVSQ